MERNKNLDLVKGIACISVLALHAVGMINYTVYYLAGCGVPLFFMVNGYLMFSRKEITYPYVFKKIGGLIRIVVLWNLIMIVPVAIFRHKIVNPVEQCIKSLLQKGYLWHFWFFGALIILYLLLPLLRKLLDKRMRLHILACGIMACLCMIGDLLSMIKGVALILYVPQAFRLWVWLFFYLVGGLISRIQLKEWKWYIAPTVILGYINNFVLKKIGLYLVHNRLADIFYGNVTSMFWYVSLFLLLLSIPIKQEKGNGICAFSELSLGIFVIHPLLMEGMNMIYIPENTWEAILYLLILVVTAGVVVTTIRKLPGGKWLIQV